jgi:flagellar capping protein FliD
VDLDYDSLMALSNASRIDAIRTIDSLSRRLGATPSRSRVSVASKASSKVSDASKMSKAPKRSSQTTPSKHRRKSSAKPTKVPSVQSTTVAEKTPKAIKAAKATKHDGNGKRKKKRDSHERRQQAEPETPPPLQTPQSIPQIQISEVIEEDTATTPNNPRISTPAPRNKINNADKRISILSFSSDSTKLGEIPERKWRSVSSTKGSSSGGGDAGQYEVRPVFPLGPYKVEVKERRFLGLFRRRREESS